MDEQSRRAGASASVALARPPRRERYPDLSPTRSLAIAADQVAWPAWTRRPIDDLGFTIAEIDERGSSDGA
jgi:hypothetical protein